MATAAGPADVYDVLASPRCSSQSPYLELTGSVPSPLPPRPSACSGYRKWACVAVASLCLVLAVPLGRRRWRLWRVDEPDSPYDWDGAASSFTQLAGSLELNRSMVAGHHLGGFCFGHDRENTAGMIWIDVQLPIKYLIDADRNGWSAKVLVFDDEERHWGVDGTMWKSSSCKEKIRRANIVTSMEVRHFIHSIAVREAYNRHWHIAVVTCPLDGYANKKWWHSKLRLDYTIYARKELSVIPMGDMDPSSCPAQPIQFVEDQIQNLEETLLTYMST